MRRGGFEKGEEGCFPERKQKKKKKKERKKKDKRRVLTFFP